MFDNNHKVWSISQGAISLHTIWIFKRNWMFLTYYQNTNGKFHWQIIYNVVEGNILRFIYKWIGIYTKQIKYFEFQSFIYQNLLFDYMFVMRKRCDIFQSTPYIHDTGLRAWSVHGYRLCTNMIKQYGVQYESML